MAGAHVGQQAPASPAPATHSLMAHMLRHTYTHIYYIGHTYRCHTPRYTQTQPCTHTITNIHARGMWCSQELGTPHRPDSHSSLTLMTQHLLKGASARWVPSRLGPRRWAGPRLGRGQGRVGGRVGGRGLQGPGPLRAASSPPPPCSECRDQTSGCCAD